MLMDKNDDINVQRAMPQANEYYTNTTNSYSQDDDILSIEISNQATTSAVPSQSTMSHVTVSSGDYSSLYTPYEVAPAIVQDPPQRADMMTFSNTTPNEESPSSILLDQDEGFMSPWGGVPEVLTEELGQPMGVPNNELTETNQDFQPAFNDQSPAQPRPLPISSQRVQEYMTVNDAGIPACKACDNSFPKRGNLARHIQTVHLKLKPFRCHLCPAYFGYKAHLKRHMSKLHQRNGDFRAQVRLDRR